MTKIEDEVTVYTVYEPSNEDDAAPEARADRIAFVKEGFNWPAFLVPALWLFYQRMWIELVVLLVVIGAVPWLLGTEGPGGALAGWITLGLTILFAFEANDLRGWALERRGYRFAGVATGRDRTEAERSFFTLWLPKQERPQRLVPPPKAGGPKPDAVVPTRTSDGDEVIGSFPRA